MAKVVYSLTILLVTSAAAPALAQSVKPFPMTATSCQHQRGAVSGCAVQFDGTTARARFKASWSNLGLKETFTGCDVKATVIACPAGRFERSDGTSGVSLPMTIYLNNTGKPSRAAFGQ